VPQKFEYNFKDCPDLVPIMVAVCCQKNVPFVFSGVRNLKIKESNRTAAMTTELKKLGFVLRELDDKMIWDGETCEKDNYPIIETYNDHRIAMMFALISLKCNLKILNPEVTDKSYWNFWHDFERMKKESER
jgi:3-phosphoshikimate 1-carboxyvinyltransferase